MFTTILYFLPCIVSLLWFSTFIFKVKTPRQKVFMWELLLAVYYFATYAMYIIPNTDYLTMVRMDVVNVPVIYMLFSLIILYVSMLYRPVKLTPTMLTLSFIPAISLGLIMVVLYYLVGFENAARLTEAYDKDLPYPEDLRTKLVDVFVFFDDELTSILSILLIAFIAIQSFLVHKHYGYRFGDVFRFLFKGRSTQPARVIAFLQIMLFAAFLPIVIMGRDYILRTPWLGAVTTVMIAIIYHFIAHVECFCKDDSVVTLHDLSHITLGIPSSYDDLGKEEEGAVESAVEAVESREDVTAPKQEASEAASEATKQTTGETVSEAMSEPASEPERRSSRSDLLFAKVTELFEVNEVYRMDNLTLDVLSEMTGIGRTTLSLLFKNHYGIAFREVVNNYRIAAVKKFLLENPTATQEAAAASCGFKDASSLNRKFREAENVTPLMWLTNNRDGV